MNERITATILDILYDGPNARSADERIAMRVLGHVCCI